MFTYKTLETTDVEILHEAFVDAFSDYQVKMNLSLEKFILMQTRRGYSPNISMGAFKGDKLVGFVFNGLRIWNGKLTVYDMGTGVVPEYRKQGITGTIMTRLMELLREKNIQQYLLEVIQDNTPAVNLYKKQGFETTRDFLCMFMSKKGKLSVKYYDIEHIDKIEAEEWRKFIEFWDFTPSWQNSIDSISAVSGAFKYSIVRINGKIVGYGIIDKKSGDLPQIAVNKEFRGKGIGTSIIMDLMEQTESERISILNVEDGAVDMEKFLYKVGFEKGVSQHEMILTL